MRMPSMPPQPCVIQALKARGLTVIQAFEVGKELRGFAGIRQGAIPL